MDRTFSRRSLLKYTMAGALLPNVVPAAFSFLHLTDIHIQPYLGATEGVRKAFAVAQSLPDKPVFALIGGDIVMSADEEDRKHAETVYELWQEAAANLKLPLHYAIGNHDVYAIRGEHAVSGNDPDFGKRWWHKRLGQEQRFRTFDHQGWRFVILDTVQVVEGRWWGEIDSEQMQWLDTLLRKTDRKQPMVFLTHVPVMTTFGLYTRGTTEALKDSHIVRNGKEFVERIHGWNVKAVLQGHTHVVEECIYLGTRYITGGAVCGDWWKGKRLGHHPEGFGIVTVQNGALTYRYIPYGWTARVE